MNRPEERLLFLATRVRTEARAREEIKALAQRGPDWNRLQRLAEKNHVLTLVYRGLEASDPGLTLGPAFAGWRDAVQANAVAAEKNLQEMLAAIDLLDTAGIRAIPFKGVVFSRHVYGDIAMRRAGDIDLLVRPADFRKAQALLIRRGYTPYYFAHAEVSTVQCALWHDEGWISIDLHYALTPYYQHTNMDQAGGGSQLAGGRENRLDADSTHWFFHLDCDPMWNRLGAVEVGGRALPIFSPEDLVIIAVMNGIKENWRMLVRVTDVADLVRMHPGVNWGWVFGQASALRFERKLAFGLLLAHELCGMPLPDATARRLRNSPTLRSLLAQTVERFGEDGFRADLEQFRLRCALFTMDGLRDRVWYFVYILRRLRQWSLRPAQALGFFGSLLRQLARSAPRR